jgi:uncharacterized protein YjbI with pentapeptide repeats/beta-lactamase regulating signal transducer with metallopeptidase domain
VNAPPLHGLTTFAGTITAIAINSLWEGALLVFCVWLLLRAWPGLNAATRYLVWSATLAAAVIVPIATTLPFLRGSPPPPPTTMMANHMTTAAATIPTRTHAHSVVPGHGPLAAQPRAAQPVSAQSPAATLHLPERFRLTLPLPFAYVIFAIWALLAVGSLARLAIGLFRLEQLKRDALPLPVEYRDAMERWAQANKGSRPVRLCVSDDIDVPVAVGLFDAMILIPRALLDRLSETEVDQISLHELAHLRRADDWSNGLQRIAIALLAWNPAVQFVGQQLDLEREVACDDWVLASTGLVRPYALCLTKMAETSSWPHHPMPAPGVFTTRKHISLRVERLLRAGRNAATNLSLGPAAATVAIVGALAFAMQLVAPSMAAPTEPAKHDVGAAVVSPLMPSGPAKTKEIVRYVRVPWNQTVAARAPATAARPAVSTVSPMQVHIPQTRVHIPQTLVHVPETLVHVPGQNLTIPPIDVKVPSVHALASATANSVDKMHVAQQTAASVAASVSAGLRSIDVSDATSVRSCDGCTMRGVDWSGRDMHGLNYTGVDLSHSKLERTNFSGGTFNGVDFSHANLRGASFHNARLTGCDFSKSDLSGVDFSGASITGCQFSDAQLPSTQLRTVLNTCTGCDFSRANLSGVDLSHVRTSGIDFSNANLAGANMSDSQFTGVDFSHARLEGANLTNTVFNGCDLSDVDLTHVDLSRAKLIGTDLSGRTSPQQ